VERWRTKIRTFHLPLGKATMTLKDAVVELGLPVDEELITSVSSGDLVILCECLLGLMPPETIHRGDTIKLFC